jgi:predicted Zn finger-like uncharacterized protein
MDTLTVVCPACRRQLRVPDGLVGELVKCPACSRTFAAPDVVEALPVAAGPAGPPPARPADPPRFAENYERDRPPEPTKPPKVLAIGIMTLVGGILAILVAMTWAATVIGLLWPGTYYSLVLGIMATVRGARLLGDRAWREPPPSGIAVMQIINVVVLDLVNLTLGILTLVFLNEREVRRYFRG